MDWDLANPLWAQALNPVLNNDILNGKLMESVLLVNGATTFNHLLGRKLKGFFITDINAAATIFRSAPLNDKTLTLTSNAICTVNLWLF